MAECMDTHYIGCKMDYPDCRCLSCANDNADEDGLLQPCCMEHGRSCGDRSRCVDYIDENAGPLRRFLQRLFRGR